MRFATWKAFHLQWIEKYPRCLSWSPPLVAPGEASICSWNKGVWGWRRSRCQSWSIIETCTAHRSLPECHSPSPLCQWTPLGLWYLLYNQSNCFVVVNGSLTFGVFSSWALGNLVASRSIQESKFLLFLTSHLVPWQYHNLIWSGFDDLLCIVCDSSWFETRVIWTCVRRQWCSLPRIPHQKPKLRMIWASSQLLEYKVCANIKDVNVTQNVGKTFSKSLNICWCWPRNLQEESQGQLTIYSGRGRQIVKSHKYLQYEHFFWENLLVFFRC